jgi:hypothetical protein
MPAPHSTRAARNARQAQRARRSNAGGAALRCCSKHARRETRRRRCRVAEHAVSLGCCESAGAPVRRASPQQRGGGDSCARTPGACKAAGSTAQRAGGASHELGRDGKRRARWMKDSSDSSVLTRTVLRYVRQQSEQVKSDETFPTAFNP